MKRKPGAKIYRIRYTRKGNKKYSSIFLNEEGTPHQCILDFDTMTYRIINRKYDRVVRSSETDGMKPASNELYLVRQAKRAIHKMKFDLGREVRDNFSESMEE